MSDNQLMFTLGLILDCYQADRELMNHDMAVQSRDERLSILGQLTDLTDKKLWLLFQLVPDWRDAETVQAQATVRMRAAGIRTQRP